MSAHHVAAASGRTLYGDLCYGVTATTRLSRNGRPIGFCPYVRERTVARRHTSSLHFRGGGKLLLGRLETRRSRSRRLRPRACDELTRSDESRADSPERRAGSNRYHGWRACETASREPARACTRASDPPDRATPYEASGMWYVAWRGNGERVVAMRGRFTHRRRFSMSMSLR